MRKLRMIIILGGILAVFSSSAQAMVDLEMLKRLSLRYPFAVVVNQEDPERLRFLYADVEQHVHLYRVQKGKLVLEWESTNLGSRVSALFARDLFHDGRLKIVIATSSGRILIYDTSDYDLVWENLQDPFEKIECMTAANIDHDPQDELVFVGDSYLTIYDSLNKNLEWQSQKKIQAQEILVANVDDDDQLEIILNTGYIVDSRFYNLEFEIDQSFGERISLFDTNNDGIPEIFGEFSNFTLKVYDIYAEREIW